MKIIGFTVALLAIAGSVAADPLSAELEDVSAEAEKLVIEHEVPGLVMAAIVGGELRATGAAGIRNRADKEPQKVEIDDKFHIGSLTKSFTAVLASTFVEEGKLTWDAKVSETLRISGMNKGFESLTFEQLLCHQGGLREQLNGALKRQAWLQANPKRTRLTLTQALLRDAPEFPPGSTYHYSNAGYTVAGAMMESLTAESWEQLVVKKIFVPLDMKSAGFLAPAVDPLDNSKTLDEPWGHNAVGRPMAPHPYGGGPVGTSPAMSIHCSILDLAKYAKFHMQKVPGPILKKKETFEDLHRPRKNQYALGWATVRPRWTGGKLALNHHGTNTMFTAQIWIVPDLNFSAMVATNIGGDSGREACEGAISALVRRYRLELLRGTR